MKDGKVTENERELLVTLAAAYGIDDDRIEQIEASFSNENNEESEKEIENNDNKNKIENKEN